jgi:hypothetical protein
MPVPASTYKPPTGAQIISAGKGNNYYVSTADKKTTVTDTGGLVLATSNDTTKGYTYTDAGKKDQNLQSALSDPNSSASKTAKQNAGVVSPNTAATNPDSSTPQITGTQQDLLNNESVKDGDYRKKYNGLKIISYPIDRDPKQDYIKFTMMRYVPKPFDIAAANSKSEKIFGERPDDKDREILGYVSLPIQPNIADSNLADWGEDSINSLDALGQGVFTSAVQGNGEQGAEQAGNVVQESLGPLKSAIAGDLAGKATGTNKNIFSRTTGAVLNPNVELLFQGPKLRGFQFNFSLSAREPDEAIVIRKIIRFFKQGMSVKKAASTLFLKAPNTFKIGYIYGKDGTDHPWINKIKECALTNFTVNYTPAGNYATFEDGAMTQYDLGLTFSELDPIYDNDYGIEDTDSNIGY